MALLNLNKNPSTRELRQFAGIWLPAAMGVIGWFIYRGTGRWDFTVGLWLLTAVVCLVGLFVPKIMRPIFVGWMIAVFPIGWTISHLLMGLVYFGMFTPLGLVMRAFGRDSMTRRLQPEASTYWISGREKRDNKSYLRQH